MSWGDSERRRPKIGPTPRVLSRVYPKRRPHFPAAHCTHSTARGRIRQSAREPNAATCIAQLPPATRTAVYLVLFICVEQRSDASAGTAYRPHWITPSSHSGSTPDDHPPRRTGTMDQRAASARPAADSSSVGRVARRRCVGERSRSILAQLEQRPATIAAKAQRDESNIDATEQQPGVGGTARAAGCHQCCQ